MNDDADPAVPLFKIHCHRFDILWIINFQIEVQLL